MFLSLLALLPVAGVGHSVTGVSPTADGKLLFVITRNTADCWLCVWDLTKPELSAVVTGLPADVLAVYPGADGKRFALFAGGREEDRRIEVWDAATKKRLRTIDVPAKEHVVTVSPDGGWVLFRALYGKSQPQVWNADTGKRAEAVEKAIGEVEAAFAFSTDAKRLIVLTETNYTEYALATGEVAKAWKRPAPAREFLESHTGRSLAALPDGKGVVSVGATAKRRQSYAVHLLTEKKEWPLGEFWDFATNPIVSPDGKLLIVSGGERSEGSRTYALKIDADGVPELEDRPEKARAIFGGGDGKKAPAWREWSLIVPDRGGRARPERERPGTFTFSLDGKRLFVVNSNAKVRVYAAESRELKATLFATAPDKAGARPSWHIVTAAGEFVGSPDEAKALAESGKVKDAAKVKEALK